MQRTILAATAAAALFLAPHAGAQCPQQVTFTRYGQTCSLNLFSASLGGTYIPSQCTLGFQLPGRTCCNVYLGTQVLLLGVAPINPGTPNPLLAPGCLVSLNPIAALVLSPAPSQGGAWSFQVPPLGGPVTLYAQGINQYFETIHMSTSFQSSDALQVDLR